MLRLNMYGVGNGDKPHTVWLAAIPSLPWRNLENIMTATGGRYP